MKKKFIIVIEIENISISGRYYSFDWKSSFNGKKLSGKYDSSFSGQSASAIRGKLKRGYAVQIILEKLITL